ncbi:hypothetical protein DFH06DRAFT_91381 [Mycena polygramma]|nr:hypothetical protein DFH06DRAFT_91381 [Mycena polygramma]
MLCKELIKPPVHMSRTEAGLKDWDEVEMRVRSLSRLERIWGKSIGGSSSKVTLDAPAGVNSGGEEREIRLFTEALRDGFVLCQLMNKLRSSPIVRPDSRDDGFVRTSNITKFLAACSSYGLPNEDLFQRDDLMEATSESLHRVARTIIALIKYVDAPIVESSTGQGKNTNARAARLYGHGISRIAAASTLNLCLPKIDQETPRDKETPPPLLPPPRSPSRPQWARVEDKPFTGAINQVSPRLAPSSTLVSLGSPVRDSFDHLQFKDVSTSSLVSTPSAMTETTTTTMISSLLDGSRHSYNTFGTIQTVTTDATSEAPSLARTEGSFIAEDLRKQAENKMYNRDSKLRESDLSRVEEMDEAGTASRRLRRQRERDQQRPPPPPDVQRVDMPTIRLGKGKRPPPKSPNPDLRAPSGPRKLAIVGATKRNENVESLPQFPRRPSHRAQHSIDTPILLAKESLMRRAGRDSSPDSMLGSRVTPRRPSVKPNRSDSPIPRDHSNDSLVPFPRSAFSPAGSSPPDRATSPLSDRPRFPRGRFQSDVEGTSRRRPRSSSYDELGVKPKRSRFESMMNLGVASGNTSASDLLLRDALDGSFVRKALIIREEGKLPSHFQLGNCIGRGQFGSVYRALNLDTGQMVAVKRIRLEGMKEDEVTTLMREVDLVKSLSHPSIVKYEGMARDQDTLSIVLEYADNGSLSQTLKAFGKLNERLAASYVVKILEGLHYLHSSDVVHCDLKAANILVTKNGNVKLSDFGVSLNLRAMEREIKDMAGTPPNWMAPEVIELKGASPKSDIWSLACTVVELLTGLPPYGEIANSMSVMFRIVEDDMPPLPEGCSHLLEDFLTQCFNKDPTKRPSAEFLCEHQWLKKNWGEHKALRPQDSIPFLRRVSADLQKSEAVRFLSQIEMPDSPMEGEELLSSSPPGRRISLSSRPMDQDISSREHSFVKATFSKPMVCRVCLLNVKKSAVLCEQCSLIAHSKCAVNAPPTCDLRAQLSLYAQYAVKGNPESAYSKPLDVLSEPHPHPMSPASQVAWVSHTPRTSLDSASPSPPHGSTPTSPVTPLNLLTAALRRSRSAEPDRPRPSSSSSSTSIVVDTSSMRSAESAARRANPKASKAKFKPRGAHSEGPGKKRRSRSAEPDHPSSSSSSTSLVVDTSSMRSAESAARRANPKASKAKFEPRGAHPESPRKKRSESRCIVQ